MVSAIPAPRSTRGSQPRTVRARVMSGTTALRVVGADVIAKDDRRRRAGESLDDLGELQHRALVRIAQVEDPAGRFRRLRARDQTLDEIAHVAKATGLLAVAVDRHRVAPQRLGDEIRHQSTILRVRPRTVAVENTHDSRVDAVLADVHHREGLGKALPLVVARPNANRIDVAPVILASADARVDRRRPRTSKRAKTSRPFAGQFEQAIRADAIHLQGFQGIPQVTDRAGRAGEVVDLVHRAVDGERLDDIGFQIREPSVRPKVGDVLRLAGNQVVDADDLVAALDQQIAEMRSDEPRSAGNERAHSVSSSSGVLPTEHRNYSKHQPE